MNESKFKCRLKFTVFQDVNPDVHRFGSLYIHFGSMSAMFLSLFRAHHAHHIAVGSGHLWQGVQPFHSWPALGACRRHAARAEARHCGERALLGHWLWPLCVPQHYTQWDVHSLSGGDLWKPGQPCLVIVTPTVSTTVCRCLTVFVCFQRWNPVDGFTDTLLPTDRWPWSDVTGLNPQPLHSFQLPSRSWEWEGDWYVDQSYGGEPSQTGVRKHTCPQDRIFEIFLIWLMEYKPSALPPGLGICSRFPSQLLPGQKVELLCSSQTLDSLQEIHRTRHLGEGLFTVLLLYISKLPMSV